jgi:hypothetical protein
MRSLLPAAFLTGVCLAVDGGAASLQSRGISEPNARTRVERANRQLFALA